MVGTNIWPGLCYLLNLLNSFQNPARKSASWWIEKFSANSEKNLLDLAAKQLKWQHCFAVVNCSDAVMSVFYSPFSTRSQNFAVMNSRVAALSLFSSDIQTWNADSLYSVQ